MVYLFLSNTNISTMNGDRFISHLQTLGVPGAESLVGSNYDWLFLSTNNAPLAAFMEWFTGNVMPADVLTDEELKEYDAALSRGDVLTSYQLEEMEECFSGLPTTYNSTEEAGQPGKLTSEEQERLESQLETLNMRKNQLSTHKMELREEVYCADEYVKATEAAHSSQLEALTNTSHHLSEAQAELSVSLDKLSDIFNNFESTPTEEVRFLSQLDLEEWSQEEAKFTDALKAYITRQFREGVREVAGAADTTKYCLLDVGHMDLHLVRGAGKIEYTQNVNELNRLSVALRQTEELRLDGLLLQARRRAEVEEANRLLGAVNRGQLPNALAMLQQQTSEAVDSRMLIERERAQQHEVLQSLIAEVAQLESTRTISGNCQLKCKRQEYFLEKQKIVMDQLKSQFARHDWIKIALDIETGKIGDILQVLKALNLNLSQKDTSYKERMKCMEEMRKETDKDKAVGQLPLPLVTLSQILPTVSNSHPGNEGHREEHINSEFLMKQVAALNRSLAVAGDQIATARNPQFSRLSNMSMNCETLEVSLFGTAGSLRTLPLTWIDPHLVERCDNLTQENWKLKQKIMQLFCNYEEKKKFLQIDPTLLSEMMQWTKDVRKLLG